ncbi:hypothetical protein GF358_00640 [Candidatus Woesearchaeota archaeon]|nr:hypothetical protein [Candidatus Woesearchaeota archaeon]
MKRTKNKFFDAQKPKKNQKISLANKAFPVKTIILGLLLIALIGCQQEGKTVSIEEPFIGGTQGLVFDFAQLREEVYDAGTDPFDISLKIENKGETTINQDNIKITLSGINPAEFSVTENQLSKTASENIISMRKDTMGNIQPGPPVFVDFENLKYTEKITGTSIDFPLRANICYLYNTKAISKLCVRKNVLTATEGICQINEEKPIFNSGAPIQISQLVENARSKAKIGFSFEIRNMGTGTAYQRGTVCDKQTRKNRDKIYLRVETNMPGITCTGLENKGTRAEGYTTLFDGVKTITCTQPVPGNIDFEQIVGIEAFYDYEEFKQTKLTVKSSGE